MSTLPTLLIGYGTLCWYCTHSTWSRVYKTVLCVSHSTVCGGFAAVGTITIMKCNKKYKHLGQKTAYLHAGQNNRLSSLKQLHNLDFRLHTVKTHTLYIARLLHSSRCGQCNVFSIRRWLNTDLFCLIYHAAVYCIAAADNCVCRLYCTTV